MSMTSSDTGARLRDHHVVWRRLRLWLEAARDRRRMRREMAALPHLPRHRLRDMGLERFSSRPHSGTGTLHVVSRPGDYR